MKNQTYRMTMLFDFYGELLTDRQKEFFDLYYNEDLSLSEIAENEGISRQGVRDVIVRAEAAQGKTNQGTLCLKGYYGWDFINDTQILTPRLKTPMIRRERGGKLEAVSWSEALDYVATRLSAIKAKYGPDAIQTTGSSRGTGNETNYVMQKFARAVIGTNNVDCCARV